jgi:hypothetical protein
MGVEAPRRHVALAPQPNGAHLLPCHPGAEAPPQAPTSLGGSERVLRSRALTTTRNYQLEIVDPGPFSQAVAVPPQGT